jgi:hypothetical protein
MKKLIFLTAVIALIVLNLGYTSAQTYQIKKSVFGASSATVEDANYKIQSTVGQSTAGSSEDASYKVYAGFWYPGASATILHTIPINSGWNMISTYIMKSPKDSFETAVTDLQGNIFLAKNGRGRIYLPDYGINQIDYWEWHEGYLLYMNDADTLTFEGEIPPADSTIKLASGWNMIAYTRDQKQVLTDCFASISGNVFLAKNGRGAIYLPDYGINQIDTLVPGQGYLLYMNNADTLDYPYPGGSLKVPAIPGTPFEPVVAKTSPMNANIIIETNLEDGSEIRAFSSSGVLTGSGIIKDGKAPVVIYGDNTYTEEIDGAREGEKITFTASSTNIEYEVTLEEVYSIFEHKEYQDFSYSNNALMTAKATMKITGTSQEEIASVSPNPTRDNAILTLQSGSLSGDITIEIYNLDGRKIETAYSGGFQDKINLGTRNLASGTYQVLIRSNDVAIPVRFVVKK